MKSGTKYHRNEYDLATLEHGLRLQLPLERIAQTIGISVPTLMKHYREQVQAASPGRGRPAYRPSAKNRETVRSMAAIGGSHEVIALALGISKATLQKHFAEELHAGRAQANFRVGANMFAMATGDPKVASTLGAAIWWTRVRMGWKEPAKYSNKPMPTANAIVVIVRPEDEEQPPNCTATSPAPWADTALFKDLTQIAENAEQAGIYLTDLDRQASEPDRKTQDAAERCLERICQAAHDLRAYAERLLPTQAWLAVEELQRQLRDGALDLDAARERLPDLIANVRRVLSHLSPRSTPVGV